MWSLLQGSTFLLFPLFLHKRKTSLKTFFCRFEKSSYLCTVNRRSPKEAVGFCRQSLFWEMAGDRHNEKTLS